MICMVFLQRLNDAFATLFTLGYFRIGPAWL